MENTRPPSARHQIARALMIASSCAFALAFAGALLDKEPFDTWFFCFAWWSYILFVDGWVQRHRKESLLLNFPGRFLFFAGFSVGLWLLFEALNFRLNNWSYANLPAGAAVRWTGYFLGFASVIPALMETADLLDTAGLVKGAWMKPLSPRAGAAPLWIATGLAMLALPLLWPAYFFPLVWGAFALLLDPLNERLGAPSLLKDLRAGSLKRLQILLLSGLLCGLLWEWWNSLARAGWTYSIPGMSDWKVFEMPVLGYLGFPAFAVEVFVLTSFALALWDRSPRPVRWLMAAGMAGVSFMLCSAVDRFTVLSFQ